MQSSGRFEISGNPTVEEEQAVIVDLERMLRDEERSRRQSAWKFSGRAASERVGITELRHQLNDRAWVLSGRLNWRGDPQDNLKGRGDAK